MNDSIIRDIIKDFNSKDLDYSVIVVANTHNIVEETKKWNYKHTTLDEFFSRKEFAEIASAIFNVFGFVRVFYSEVEFIKNMIENNQNKANTVVYNLARDGIHEGKKSLIPSFCDLFGIKYTGSNAFVISLLRNKYVYSNFLHQLGIPIPNTFLYDVFEGFITSFPADGRKIVKYINESASIGLTNNNIIEFENNASCLKKLQNITNQMQTEKVIVQDYIEGDECEVLVIKYKQKYYALDPIMIDIHGSSIITSNISNAYDYDFCLLSEKYNNQLCSDICKCAEKAATLLNIDTYARFDFRIDSNNNYYLFDIAGTPYTIKHSSISYIFKKYGFRYEDIYKTFVQIAMS